jgi:tetratricopeptide (TPR) repeat protein
MDQYLAGTDDEATRYLLNAVDLTSEPETALRYLGDLQLERPSPPDPTAVAKLCEYSDRQPKEGQLQFYCGAVLFRRGFVLADKSHSAEILRRLRAAATLLPKDASPHCQLGKAYRWLGNWQEARGESEICARMDPNSADAHYRLAQIYEHLGQQQQKQKEIKLYEAASSRVADENARRAETLKTFMLTIQNGAADQK